MALLGGDILEAQEVNAMLAQRMMPKERKGMSFVGTAEKLGSQLEVMLKWRIGNHLSYWVCLALNSHYVCGIR